MMTMSKALSAGQAQTYYQKEYTSAKENYYSEGETISGEWHGQLAAEWGLTSKVEEAHFDRLAEGQHPITGEQLVRHRGAQRHARRDCRSAQHCHE